MTRRVGVAAAAVVAMTLVAGCGQAGKSIPPVSSPSGPSTADRTPPGSNRAATWHTVRQVLADAPVVPDARLARRAPVAALRKPEQSIASSNLVMATRWWTAPGTVSAALRYWRAHPPAGLRVGGRGTRTSPGVVVESLSFDGHPTHAYSQLTLVMAVTQQPHGVAVRAEAQALWLPSRTTAEHIPPTVKSVDVTVRRPGVAPIVHRIVSGHRAGVLADAVNRLPVFPPGTYNCPADRGFVDSLVFHMPGPDVVVRAHVGGCSIVSVTVGHRSQPALNGGGPVDAAVVKVLHLPKKYSR